jgi:transcriptional regulator with XRE-family HTH domain
MVKDIDFDLPPPERFGLFLKVNLNYAGISVGEFAERLGMDTDLIESIIEGLFPPSLIDDDMLARFASELNLYPDVLRIILGRQELEPLGEEDEEETAPAADPRQAELWQVLEDMKRAANGYTIAELQDPKPSELNNPVQTLDYFVTGSDNPEAIPQPKRKDPKVATQQMMKLLDQFKNMDDDLSAR